MLDWVIDNKEWVLSGVGVAVLGFITKSVTVLRKLLKGDNVLTRGLAGNYLVYFPRPHCAGSFLKCPAKIVQRIDKKLIGKLKVREFIYSGAIETQDGTIFVDFESSGSKTHFVAYLHRNIGANSYLEGVHLSRSRRRMPLATRMFAEKAALEFEETNSEFVNADALPERVACFFNSVPSILYLTTPKENGNE